MEIKIKSGNHRRLNSNKSVNASTEFIWYWPLFNVNIRISTTVSISRVGITRYVYQQISLAVSLWLDDNELLLSNFIGCRYWHHDDMRNGFFNTILMLFTFFYFNTQMSLRTDFISPHFAETRDECEHHLSLPQMNIKNHLKLTEK